MSCYLKPVKKPTNKTPLDERRYNPSLQRSVSIRGRAKVFLRHLEYFQGIMFLTTNRVTTFDDAFRGRITFAMKFDDLSTKAKKIWETFLRKVPTEKVSDKDIDGLSHKNINGGQVRWRQSGGSVTSINS
jgi:hypothetical protein